MGQEGKGTREEVHRGGEHADHEIVRAANLTPEELAVIIRKAAVSMPDRPAEDVIREAGYDED